MRRPGRKPGRGRGRGRRARGKWRRRQLRRTGLGGAAGWRWMQQVTGPAGAAPGDGLRGALRPPSWIPGEVRRADGNIAPRDNLQEGYMARLCHLPLPSPGKGVGPESHSLSSSSTFSSPQRDGFRSNWECFSCSSSPGHSQYLRPLDSHALPGGAAYAG